MCWNIIKCDVIIIYNNVKAIYYTIKTFKLSRKLKTIQVYVSTENKQNCYVNNIQTKSKNMHGISKQIFK